MPSVSLSASYHQRALCGALESLYSRECLSTLTISRVGASRSGVLKALDRVTSFWTTTGTAGLAIFPLASIAPIISC
jgi:hypothetical protein